jgi:acyl-CoA synthetase (AMP-forming)/AMP-acid ligase II
MPSAAPGFAVGYGMTEMSFLTIGLAQEMIERPGLVGRPVPGVEMRQGGTSRDDEGELLARNAALMLGYFNSDENPIDAEGWYHTGDLGRIDRDGNVFVTGRVKDIIIRGGENISCPRVEAAMARHNDIIEVAAVGYPDEDFGEVVVAVIFARAGARISEDELVEFAKEHLAYFELPTRWVFRDNPLPVLPTGKVDKRRLARQLSVGLSND